jgi:hypothetical protein
MDTNNKLEKIRRKSRKRVERGLKCYEIGDTAALSIITRMTVSDPVLINLITFMYFISPGVTFRLFRA